MVSESLESNHDKTKNPRRRSPVRIALGATGAALLLTVAAIGWLAGTESGARFALSALAQSSAGSLQLEGITGKLAGPLQIQRMTIDDRTQLLTLTDLQLDWRPRALLERTVHLTSLRMAQMKITSKLDREPSVALLPEQIDLPLRLKVDRLRIDSGEIGWGPVNLVKLGTLILNADYDGVRYRLGLEQFAAQAASGSSNFAGTFSGQATLSTTRPYAVQARITSEGQALVEDKKIGAVGNLNLDGSLAELVTTLNLAIGEASVKGSATLRAFSDKPLAAANLTAQAVDLSALAAGLPQTRLDLRLAAADTGAGELVIRNTDAGLLNEQKIPLSDLAVSFRQDAGHFLFSRIDATLGTPKQIAGVITGSGDFKDGGLTLALATAALDLRRLDQRMQPTQLSGNVDIRHGSGKQEITLALRAPLNQKNTLTLSAHAVLADASVTVDRAQLTLGNGQIDASARIDLADKQAFSAEGKISRFRLHDLGRFAQVPSLDLNGDFLLRGARQPQLVADLSFRIANSQLAGQPLRGEGKVQLRTDSLLIPNLLLIAGDNKITANGALTQEAGDLSFLIAAPNLAQFGPHFSGALQAEGTVKGSLKQPRIRAEWHASQLKLQDGIVIDAMQGTADMTLDRSKPLLLRAASIDASVLGLKSGAVAIASANARVQFSPEPSAPLAIALRATGVVAQGVNADKIAVTASGTTARHTLELGVTETAQDWPPQDWQLSASGGMQDLASAPQWQGTIDRLDASGRFVARLAAPAPLLVSQKKVQLDRFRLDANSVSIAVEQFLRDPRGIMTRGRFDKLNVAKILEFAGTQPALSTDLQLGGEWNVSLTEVMTGSVKLARQGGDITMRGNVPVVLGLRELTATLTATSGRLALEGLADGTRLGRIAVRAGIDTDLAQSKIVNGANGAHRFALAPNAAVSGIATIDMPSLGWIAPLVSPSLIAEGRVQSKVTLGGTFGQPSLGGQINGSGLRLLFTDLGLDLQQGTLETEFRDAQLLIKKLRFQTGQGSLSASGPLGFAGGKPSAKIALVADQFTLLNRADRKLVLSGSSQIDWLEGRAKVSGEFGVDSGFFDIGQQDMPQLSDDVIVIGRPKKSASALALALDLGIDLRDGVALKGRGISANLVGKLTLQSAAGEPLRAVGALRTASGTFSAYGRELAIEQGQLRFNGTLANPSLDIVAMRRGQEVAAGVSVRGNVLAPRITLVSEPTVPDAEKLSWLVLGRGLDAAGGSDIGALQRAAGALLSDGAAAGVQSHIATAFGLDDFRIGSSTDGLQSRIVTLGKKISSRLYVSYEKSLESTSNIVLLRYTLSPRLTLEAETGTRSALSLFYNLAFD